MSGVISQRCPSESFLLFLSAAGSEMGRAAGGGKFSWQDLSEHIGLRPPAPFFIRVSKCEASALYVQKQLNK